MEQKRIDIALLLLRAVPAVLLIVYHGWSKLTSATAYLFQQQGWRFIGGVESLGFPAPSFFAICSALAESFGALFLALGLFTRYAAAIVVINMSVAVYRHISAQQPFDFPALYLLLAAIFLFLPPGRFSLDTLLRARK